MALRTSALGLVLAVLAPSIAAAEGWSPPTTISDTGVSIGQQVSDAQGNATVSWAQQDGTFLARAAQGQAFGSPTELRAAGSEQIAPRLAVDAHGTVYAAWRTSEGVHAIDGRSRPERLAAYDRRQVPSVGAGDGIGAVAWRQYREPTYSIHVALSAAAGGFDGARTVAADAAPKHDPLVAVTPGGQVVIAWSSPEQRVSVVRGGRGGFSAREFASPAGDPARLVALMSDAVGGITAVWIGSGEQGVSLRAAYAAPGDTFGAPTDLASGGDAPAASIAPVPSGALVAWRADDNGIAVSDIERGMIVRRSRIDARPAPLGPTSPYVAAAAASDGGAVATWVENGGELVAARRAPGATAFGTPHGIVSADEVHELRALAAPGGEARVIWARKPPGGTSNGDELRSTFFSADAAGVHADRTAPRLGVRLARGQRLSSARRRAVVRVQASERARLRVTARVRAGSRTVRLISVGRTIRARRWTTVRIAVPRKARRAIRRASRARLWVTVAARDRAGNVRRVTRSVPAR